MCQSKEHWVSHRDRTPHRHTAHECSQPMGEEVTHRDDEAGKMYQAMKADGTGSQNLLTPSLYDFTLSKPKQASGWNLAVP